MKTDSPTKRVLIGKAGGKIYVVEGEPENVISVIVPFVEFTKEDIATLIRLLKELAEA